MFREADRMRDRDGVRVTAARRSFSAQIGEAQEILSSLVSRGLNLRDLERDNDKLLIGGVLTVLVAVVVVGWVPGVYVVDATILRPTSEYLIDLFSPTS